MPEHLVPAASIERLIIVLRGRKVMLDQDLARLYGVETRVLNQAVKRNRQRFPEAFLFELTREEIQRISQIVTSSDVRYSKKIQACTRERMAMLSGVLRSRRAVQVKVEIM